MTEATMPAAEAAVDTRDEKESYEFAFHILPTVAEGEVASVFETIKGHLAKYAEMNAEEVPERIDLVYPIEKSIEGKNRKFTSAYFGWVRFKAEREKITELTEELASVQAILRHLLIKLTPLEEAHPFRFHEHRKSVKMVEVVREQPETLDEAKTEVEENVEVSEKALDESLEKITHDGADEKKPG
jgi:ribosomal protein S6